MSTQSAGAQTNVQQVDLDIDSLFSGAPDASSIVTAGAETPNLTNEVKKPGFFSKDKVDLSFLDPGKKDEEEEEEEESKEDGEKKEELVSRETLDELLKEDEEQQEKSGGRPRVDKSGLVDTMTKLIDEGLIVPFDDDKPMEEYSVKDWKELLEANFQEREKKVCF